MIKHLLLTLIFAFSLLGSQAFAQTYVQEEEIVRALKKEYVERVGEGDEVEFEFYGGQTNFTFEQIGQVKVMIANARFDEMQNKFSAEVEIFAGGKSAAKTTLQGKFYTLTEIFVPGQNINKGEMIDADKLKSIKIRANRIKPQNLVEKDKLIGMEAKRNLREGKIINEKDVGKLVIIKKGALVNSVYQTPHMQISAQAEAMSDGCRGERIEIRNTKSKKTFYGEVIDAETVRVEQQ